MTELLLVLDARYGSKSILADSKLSASWAAYGRGERNFVVAVIGSSTPRGEKSGNGTTNMYVNGWPKKVSQKLVARGHRARHDALIGGGTVDPAGMNLAARDPRVVLTGNWFTDTNMAIGGHRLRANAAANIAFTPELPFDRFTVYYQSFASPGSATVNVDGGASLGTIDRNAAEQLVASQTFTVSLGTHTINLAWATGSFGVIGIRPYRNDQTEIEFLNFAAGAADITQGIFDPADVSSPIQAYPALGRFGPIDLFIIATGRNEWANGSSIATMKSRMRAFGDKAELAGAQVLIVTPFQEALYTSNNGVAYVQAQIDLAAEEGWLLLNNATFFGAYVPGSRVESGDGTHKNDFGHTLMADTFLTSIFG